MARDPLEGRYPVDVGGEYRGVALAGQAMLELRADAVALLAGADVAPEDTQREFVIPLGRLAGARYSDGLLTLRLAEGAITLRGEGRLAAVGRDLVARACDPGELTLALRTLGSHRAGADALQKRFFEPLLSARKRLAKASEPRAQAAALDVPHLRQAYESLTLDVAREWGSSNAADRRAIEAHLGERIEPLLASLASLGESAEALRAASDDATIVAWREWASAARAVFAAADRCWPPVATLLHAWRPSSRPSLWRRLFGGVA
jgi:hypothetical protein